MLAVLNAAVVRRSGLPNPRYAYLPIDPANAAALAFARGSGARHEPSLDVILGGTVQQCHVLDHGPGGMLGERRDLVYAELGLTPPAAGDDPPPLAALGADPDADSVAQALRGVNRPAELARNALGNGMERGPVERVAAIRRLLEDGVREAFGTEHPDRLRGDLLIRRYFSDPTTHEQTADAMHVSRSTYFRHHRRATETLARHVLAV